MSLFRSSAVLSLLCFRASGKESIFELDVIVRILQKSAFTVVNCLLHHIRLMFTGEATVKRSGFSPIVALSSLLYIANAIAFWHYSNSISVAFIFSLVTITSLVSDSLVCSPFWRTTDRLVSTTACKRQCALDLSLRPHTCSEGCVFSSFVRQGLLVRFHFSHFMLSCSPCFCEIRCSPVGPNPWFTFSHSLHIHPHSATLSGLLLHPSPLLE